MNLQLKYVTDEQGERHLTISPDQRARVITYVQEGGAASKERIEEILEEGHAQFASALEGLTEAQAQFKPGPEDWSVLELMAHAVTVKRAVTGLCESMSKGALPPGIGPEFEEERRQDGMTLVKFNTLAEARAADDEAHTAMVAFVRSLDGSANLEMRFKHFLFGPMNCREWACFQRVHDGDHAPQIAAIRASRGFPSA
jgi:hypothetical protein